MFVRAVLCSIDLEADALDLRGDRWLFLLLAVGGQRIVALVSLWITSSLVIVKGLCNCVGSSIGLLFGRLVRLRDLFLTDAVCLLIRLPLNSAALPL